MGPVISRAEYCRARNRADDNPQSTNDRYAAPARPHAAAPPSLYESPLSDATLNNASASILENSVISDAKIDNILQTGQIMLQAHADRQIKKDYK
jgi:hypothetical protein